MGNKILRASCAPQGGAPGLIIKKKKRDNTKPSLLGVGRGKKIRQAFLHKRGKGKCIYQKTVACNKKEREVGGRRRES